MFKKPDTKKVHQQIYRYKHTRYLHEHTTRYLAGVRITGKVGRSKAFNAKHTIFSTTRVMIRTSLMVTTVTANKIPTSSTWSTQALTNRAFCYLIAGRCIANVGSSCITVHTEFLVSLAQLT